MKRFFAIAFSCLLATAAFADTTFEGLQHVPNAITGSEVAALNQGTCPTCTYKVLLSELQTFMNSTLANVARSGLAQDLTGTLDFARLGTQAANSVLGNCTGAPALATACSALSGIDASAAKATATGASIARTLSASQSDVSNALNFGADPTGVADSTAAINAAAANVSRAGGVPGAVYLPAGTYLVRNVSTLSHGQCLYGNGDHATFINVDSTFSPSAIGVLSFTGLEVNAPCAHDLSISFAQPGRNQTTTTSAQASGTTFTVASVANMANGDIIADDTTAAIPAQTTITISGNTITTSATVTGLLNGDNISTYKPRASYAALGTCTSAAGGTGCQYPPAITAGNGAANRVRIWNVHVQGAWDGFDLRGNVTPTINNIEMGALHIGLQLDGAKDFVHVHGWHNWPFGFRSDGPWSDGSTIGWEIGRVDGFDAASGGFFQSSLHVTANATPSAVGSTYSNFHFDGTNSAISIDGGKYNLFADLKKDGQTSNSTCPINVTAGTTEISGFQITDAANLTTASEVCVTGGTLSVKSGGFSHNGTTQNAFSVSAGKLDVEGVYFTPPATFTAPLVAQTGGTLIFKGNTSNNVGSGVAYSVTSDNVSNVVTANDLLHQTYSIPAGALNGRYDAPTWRTSGGVSVPPGCISGAAVTHTGDTSEFNLGSCYIRGGTLGPNGAIEVSPLYQYTNNANVKNLVVRLNTTQGAVAGGAIIGNAAPTATVSAQPVWTIRNQNSESAQLTFNATATTPNGATANTPTAGTLNTANDSWVNINCQLTNAADTCGDFGFIVKVYVP